MFKRIPIIALWGQSKEVRQWSRVLTSTQRHEPRKYEDFTFKPTEDCGYTDIVVSFSDPDFEIRLKALLFLTTVRITIIYDPATLPDTMTESGLCERQRMLLSRFCQYPEKTRCIPSIQFF